MLWQLQRTGDVLAVGTYDVAGAGSVTRSMPLRDAADAAKLAVTLESGRTAPASPTGPILAGARPGWTAE